MKIIIKEENFKWHLEAFASELFIYCVTKPPPNKSISNFLFPLLIVRYTCMSKY